MTLDYSKHKNVLLSILKDIYTDTVLGTALGFKGGTAALLFYGLNRNSVDLDFDLLDDTREQQVFEKLQMITASYGKITESKVKRFNLLNVVSYALGALQLKVEVNRRNFGSQYEVKTLLGISMQVMVQPDMFAHKLMAMYERAGDTSRDIFDVYFFYKNMWDINKTIVEARAGVPFAELLQKCIDKLEVLDNKYILNGLGELLTSQQKDWARVKLKSETLFFLKLALDNEKQILK